MNASMKMPAKNAPADAAAPMRTRLRDYRMLWRAAVTHANPHPSRILSWGVTFLLIVIGAGVTIKIGPRSGLAWFWCAASALLLLHWAWRFVPGAVKLNAPAYAKLVPRMRRRLVELSALVCCLAIAGIASAPYADASRLGAWLFWIVVLVVLIGLGQAGHRAANPAGTVAAFSWFFVEQLPASLVGLVSHPLAVVLALPVYAVVIVMVARAMFPEGGERHWAMLALRARWAPAAGKRGLLSDSFAAAQTRVWYSATLRRAGARRDGRRLLVHALGPAHHYGDAVAGLAVLGVVMLATGTFAAWRNGPESVSVLSWVFACIMLFVPVAHAVRLGQLSGERAAEQALVRLAPAIPARADAFNAVLGRGLLRQALAVWLVASGVALLLVALSGAGTSGLLPMAGVCCLVLPVVTVPLRDHASRSESAVLRAFVLLLASVAASAIAGVAVHAVGGIAMLPLAAVAGIGLTVFLAVRGLRTMEAAPCAFPAGRMD